MNTTFRRFDLLALCLGAAACASTAQPSPPASPPTIAAQKPEPPPAPKSLFERLGGLPAIRAVVTEFYANIAADEEVNASFAVADLENLHHQLVDFVCSATGGPCKYGGRSMKEAHQSMGVTGAQFDRVVGDLARALDKLAVPQKEKNELLGALGPLKKDIIEAD